MNSFFKRVTTATLTTALAASMAGALPVMAASSTDTTNNTAISNALTNADIIDMSKKFSTEI